MSQPEEKDGSDDWQFLSTQMQVRHEQFQEAELREQNKACVISRIQHYKNGSTPDTSPKRKLPAVEAKSIKSVSKKRVSKKSNPRKIGSLSAYVRDRLGKKDAINDIRKDEKDRMTQVSILEYFSGDKKKVNDILKRIEREEANKPQQRDQEQGDGANYAGHDLQTLYTKEEWAGILRSIKVRFPSLSSRTKKSLKTITRRIQKYADIHELDVAISQSPLWSQAAANPDDSLTPDELRWLYDLDDDEMINEHSTFINDSEAEHVQVEPFVMTLSQVLKSESQSQNDGSNANCIHESTASEVSDSENSDVELLEIPPHQPESISNIHNPATLPPSLRDTQTTAFQSLNAHNTPEKRQIEFGTLDQPIELSSDRDVSLTPTTRNRRSSVVVVSSPVEPTSENHGYASPSPFVSPNKKTISYLKKTDPLSPDAKQSYQNAPFSSPLKSATASPIKIKRFGTDVAQVHQNSQHTKEDSKVDVLESPFNRPDDPDDDEEIFSTAKSEIIRSSIPHSKSTIPILSSQVVDDQEDQSQRLVDSTTEKSKVPATWYRTSRVELRGDFDIADRSWDEKYKVRRIGTKVISLDSDEEVPDTEDELFNEENDISILEVSIPRGAGLNPSAATKNTCGDEGNTSVLQVPSSPEQGILNMLPSSDSFEPYHAFSNSQPRYMGGQNVLPESDTPIVTPGEDAHQASPSKSNVDTSSKEKKSQKKPKRPKAQKPAEGDAQTLWGNVFDQMTMVELSERIKPWNVKSFNSRTKIIKLLSNGLSIIRPDMVSEDFKESQLSRLVPGGEDPQSFRTAVFERLSSTIKTSTYWFNKIVTFEPVNLEQLHQWLETDKFKFSIERSILEDFCHDFGIACTKSNG